MPLSKGDILTLTDCCLVLIFCNNAGRDLPRHTLMPTPHRRPICSKLDSVQGLSFSRPKASLGVLPIGGLVRRLKPQVLSTAFLFIISPMVWAHDGNNWTANDALGIHFFNVGTGTCTLIKCPGEGARPIVVDCGSKGSMSREMKNQLKNRFKEFFSTNQSPDVVLSHGDEDHYNLIPKVLDEIIANSVWMGDTDPNHNNYDKINKWFNKQKSNGATIWTKFKAGWNTNGSSSGGKTNLREPISGKTDLTSEKGESVTDELDCGKAEVSILAVNTKSNGKGTNGNARSLVLMLQYEKFKAIFTGDAFGITEDQARKNFSGKDLQTTVLTSSHHGADTNESNSEDWIDATSPAIAVYSAGKHLWYRHPRCTTVERLREKLKVTDEHKAICGEQNSGFREYAIKNAEFMTQTSGTITITTDGKSHVHVDYENRNKKTGPIQIQF